MKRVDKLDQFTESNELDTELDATGKLVQTGLEYCQRLPLKTQRSEREKAAGDSLMTLVSGMVKNLSRKHRVEIYERLTQGYTRFHRVDDLLYHAADIFPDIVPTRSQVEKEALQMQADKDGLEILQGNFISQILREEKSGIHLLTSMLRPKEISLELLGKFKKEGKIELEYAKIDLKDGAAHVEFNNTRYLNAEDDLSLIDQETVVDLVLLNPDAQLGVLRGALVDHPRHKGLRVFDSGINLTKIYHGKLPFLFYLIRDFGLVNKFYYGLAGNEWDEQDPDNTLEKIWIAAVDRFAIGGGCQILLVMDYVIAEAGSYFNIPARKEGIIPGAANLRFPRFAGEKLARQGIMFDKTFYVDSPEAAGLINEVVTKDKMDETIGRVVANATGSGMVSASGNRKALRLQNETLDLFRQYMASYSEIQAKCHLSPQLIENLEKHWQAKEKGLK
ncbi:MAG: enoyl-CoA hydratase/isomerase family protein [Proteobacteria bacterium]|nr:enoyl-CoA hydratase/isomerase family protein [Pseudomonadota bacterium]